MMYNKSIERRINKNEEERRTMRKLNRIKKQRRPFTKEHFYIYSTTTGMYQFRDRQSHRVISTSGTLADIKRCVTLILNRYKNYDLYLKAISSMSEKDVTEKDFVKREKEWKKRGREYENIIEDLLREYYIEQEEKEDYKHRRVILPVTPVQRPVEAETSPKPLGVVKLSKKRRSRL